jgi:hypothetical protein
MCGVTAYLLATLCIQQFYPLLRVTQISGCLYGRMDSLGQDPGAVFAGSNRNPLNEETSTIATRQECVENEFHHCIMIVLCIVLSLFI